MPYFTLEEIEDAMRKPNNIRNISIFADESSGKSTIKEHLQTSYGLKMAREAGTACYTDTCEEYHEIGIKITSDLD
jgi:elongation factor 2